MKSNIFLAAVLMVIPLSSFAHEVKHTGTFDILLHMEPQDSPIARETSQLYFSVTDSANRFSFTDCECKVTINDGSKNLLSRNLTSEDEAPDWGANVSRVSFVFPALGIYSVTLEGYSKANLYQDFHLDYNVRIERESVVQPALDPLPEEAPGLKNYYIIGGSMIVLGIILYKVKNKLKKRKYYE